MDLLARVRASPRPRSSPGRRRWTPLSRHGDGRRPAGLRDTAPRTDAGDEASTRSGSWPRRAAPLRSRARGRRGRPHGVRGRARGLERGAAACQLTSGGAHPRRRVDALPRRAAGRARRARSWKCTDRHDQPAQPRRWRRRGSSACETRRAAGGHGRRAAARSGAASSGSARRTAASVSQVLGEREPRSSSSTRGRAFHGAGDAARSRSTPPRR